MNVDGTTQALLLALLGAVLGAGVTLSWRVSERQMRGHSAPEAPVVPPGVATVLGVLRSSALVVDEYDEVLQASAPAYALGLVRGNQLTIDELATLVRQVRRDGQIRETELQLTRGRGTPSITVVARVAPLGSRLVLALVEDRTRERRVEAIRRDFVANVSHELKTPVGALNLLAEAVQSVLSSFGEQGSGIEVEIPRKQRVLADPDHLHQMLTNYVANALKYGRAPYTIDSRMDNGFVEIRVSDRGDGVPEAFVPRLFERFAQAGQGDGGTGLGLSIVRGLAVAQGGDAWYEPCEPHGGCFGIRLLAA